MKKISLILIICLSLLFTTSVLADDREVTVILNGNKLVSDVAPQLVNSRTMLPIRAVFEGLGAEVSWVEENQLIFATKDNVMITLKIGVPNMSVQKIGNNENVSVELDTAPYLFNGRTMIPVRAVAEALDARVDWDDASRTVTITK